MINKITMNTEDFGNDFVLEIDGVKFTLEELIKIKENNPLEFNEDNIRKIADKCFTANKWRMYILKQFHNTEVTYRKNINRNNFIDDIVRGCIDGNVMHLTKEWHRGISKSHFINEMSRLFEIPVFREHKYIVCGDNCYTNTNQLRGCRFDKILVDECSVETVNKIRKMGITPIGFACTYKNYELI